MPPKFRFTKRELIDAAFNLVRYKGWNTLSTRTLASELVHQIINSSGVNVNRGGVDEHVEITGKEKAGQLDGVNVS